MKQHFVIDPLISKRQQLLLATQLCRMVLKVRCLFLPRFISQLSNLFLFRRVLPFQFPNSARTLPLLSHPYALLPPPSLLSHHPDSITPGSLLPARHTLAQGYTLATLLSAGSGEASAHEMQVSRCTWGIAQTRRVRRGNHEPHVWERGIGNTRLPFLMRDSCTSLLVLRIP